MFIYNYKVILKDSTSNVTSTVGIVEDVTPTGAGWSKGYSLFFSSPKLMRYEDRVEAVVASETQDDNMLSLLIALLKEYVSRKLKAVEEDYNAKIGNLSKINTMRLNIRRLYCTWDGKVSYQESAHCKYSVVRYKGGTETLVRYGVVNRGDKTTEYFPEPKIKFYHSATEGDKLVKIEASVADIKGLTHSLQDLGDLLLETVQGMEIAEGEKKVYVDAISSYLNRNVLRLGGSVLACSGQ